MTYDSLGNVWDLNRVCLCIPENYLCYFLFFFHAPVKCIRTLCLFVTHHFTQAKDDKQLFRLFTFYETSNKQVSHLI